MEIAINVTQEDDWDIITYVGPINEEAEVHLPQLLNRLGKKCLFNFKQVEHINSCGVRGWINFIREAEKDREIVFEECTPEIVMQMNMIPSFKSTAQIKSVYACYNCEECDEEHQILFQQGKNLPEGPDEDIEDARCPKCSNVMEMEEVEDEFFSFLEAS